MFWGRGFFLFCERTTPISSMCHLISNSIRRVCLDCYFLLCNINIKNNNFNIHSKSVPNIKITTILCIMCNSTAHFNIVLYDVCWRG